MPLPTEGSKMLLIVLEPLLHRCKQWIAIKAPNLEGINQQLQLLPGRKFSKTHTCWLVPLNRELYKKTYFKL